MLIAAFFLGTCCGFTLLIAIGFYLEKRKKELREKNEVYILVRMMECNTFFMLHDKDGHLLSSDIFNNDKVALVFPHEYLQSLKEAAITEIDNLRV